MPGLIAPQSPIELKARYSQPLLLLGVAGLLVVAPRYEGMDPWLLEARHKLGDDALNDLIDALSATGGVYRLPEQMIAHMPPDIVTGSAESFLDALAQVPVEKWAEWLQQAVGHNTTLSLDDTNALVEHLKSSHHPPSNMERALELLRHPAMHKELVHHGLRRLWERVYRDQYQQEEHILRQAAKALEAYSGPMTFRSVFLRLANRPLPMSLERDVDNVRTLIAIPMLHIGPYVVYCWDKQTLYLYYNAQLTLSEEQKRTIHQPLLEFYPALKALGDETRLKIISLLRQREMYAQEIVDAVDVSQAAVSRHLRLLVSSGVLKVRRSGGQKFYSLDKETIKRLSTAFQKLGE